MRRPALHTAAALLLTAIAACTQDDYDKGEGRYSLTRADFVEAHVNGEKILDYIVTDDGDSLTLSNPFPATWQATPDSLYRLLFYYNRANSQAEAVDFSLVSTVSAHEAAYFKDSIATDPIHFQSAWVSASGKYINLGLRVMTGNVTTDGFEMQRQSFGIVADSLATHSDSTRTQHLRLYHSQGNQPEHYSMPFYLSIRTASVAADSVCITINTYDGTVSRTLPL